VTWLRSIFHTANLSVYHLKADRPRWPGDVNITRKGKRRKGPKWTTGGEVMGPSCNGLKFIVQITLARSGKIKLITYVRNDPREQYVFYVEFWALDHNSIPLSYSLIVGSMKHQTCVIAIVFFFETWAPRILSVLWDLPPELDVWMKDTHAAYWIDIE